jgi:hypothetical protein
MTSSRRLITLITFTIISFALSYDLIIKFPNGRSVRFSSENKQVYFFHEKVIYSFIKFSVNSISLLHVDRSLAKRIRIGQCLIERFKKNFLGNFKLLENEQNIYRPMNINFFFPICSEGSNTGQELRFSFTDGQSPHNYVERAYLVGRLNEIEINKDSILVGPIYINFASNKDSARLMQT